jgi:2-dehydro-3-deoxy-D-arabinonate dehydratase
MKVFRTTSGVVVEKAGRYCSVAGIEWDDLLCSPNPIAVIEAAGQEPIGGLDHLEVLAPVINQEVWAAGVTYYRSRDARIEESQGSGGHTFYDHAYSAERPELFFKATGRRVVGSGSAIRIRSDSKWSVPEPELTLVINPAGKIIGYTIGNDVSARDIEGENPLYLPQAKIYDGSCAIGPCILLRSDPLDRNVAITMTIERDKKTTFSESTTLAELKREPKVLAEFLFRDNSFPQGVFLMTGTGIVPGGSFTLRKGDVVTIYIDEIGDLRNHVE